MRTNAATTFADANCIKAEHCNMEIGSMISTAAWWSDALTKVPSEVWGQIDELMADGDTCEVGNVLMEWGRKYAKKIVETKYRVRLL